MVRDTVIQVSVYAKNQGNFAKSSCYHQFMKKIITFSCFLFVCHCSFAQSKDSTPTTSFFRGQITATNNGISLIPNFSLNNPAALFDLSVGKGRLSFDPMFRFGLNAKPWAFVFWFRYKLITNKKFSMSIGAHPSFLFRTETITINGKDKEVMTVQRYFAWEATPTYHLSKKIGVGLYYLGSHGLTKDLIQFTHFVAFRVITANIPLGKHLNFMFIPQVYYLEQDQVAGTYINATLGLAKKNFPVSVSLTANQTLQSEIKGEDFLWSVGLVYNINKEYERKR